MKFSILLLIATAFFSFTKAEQEYKSAYTYCALSYFYDDDNYEMLLLSGGFVRNLFEKSDIYNDIDIIVNPDVSKFNTLNEMQDYLKELFLKNNKKLKMEEIWSNCKNKCRDIPMLAGFGNNLVTPFYANYGVCGISIDLVIPHKIESFKAAKVYSLKEARKTKDFDVNSLFMSINIKDNLIKNLNSEDVLLKTLKSLDENEDQIIFKNILEKKMNFFSIESFYSNPGLFGRLLKMINKGYSLTETQVDLFKSEFNISMKDSIFDNKKKMERLVNNLNPSNGSDIHQKIFDDARFSAKSQSIEKFENLIGTDIESFSRDVFQSIFKKKRKFIKKRKFFKKRK